MSDLVARRGRHQQCYDAGYRLVVGEVPGKLRIQEQNSPRQVQPRRFMRFYVASPSGITKVLPVDFPDQDRFGYHIEAKCYGP